MLNLVEHTHCITGNSPGAGFVIQHRRRACRVSVGGLCRTRQPQAANTQEEAQVMLPVHTVNHHPHSHLDTLCHFYWSEALGSLTRLCAYQKYVCTQDFICPLHRHPGLPLLPTHQCTNRGRVVTWETAQPAGEPGLCGDLTSTSICLHFPQTVFIPILKMRTNALTNRVDLYGPQAPPPSRARHLSCDSRYLSFHRSQSAASLFPSLPRDSSISLAHSMG